MDKADRYTIGEKCAISGLAYSGNRRWLHKRHSAKLNCSFYLIGSDILLTVPEGFADYEGMKDFIEQRKSFLAEYGLQDKKHVEIKDYSLLTGQTPRKSRSLFVDFLKAEQERGYLQGFYGFNTSFIMKSLFNIGISMFAHKMPVMIYTSYKQALNEAIKTLKAREPVEDKQQKINEEELKAKLVSFFPSESYIDKLSISIHELFTYINSINWSENENFETDRLLEQEHPFYQLYNALHVLKTDFKDTLNKQKKVERDLIEANNHMEQLVEKRTKELAQKNTILETSLSILSHDTKNLFFNISYLIDQELEGPIRTLFKEFYDELYDNVMETTGYIKDKVRIFSLIEILGKIKLTSERTPLESHPRVTVLYEGKAEMFYIETSTLFKNAIMNIVENALKYTAIDKGITLDISRINQNESTDSIRINIIDQGQGIPDDEKIRIFEKGFRREKTKKIEGTGRGLWITKNIIEKAGGTLRVCDNPGGGSIFQIDVPAFHVKDFNDSLLQLSGWFSVPIEIIKERAENLEMLVSMNNQKINDLPSFIFVSILNQLRLENKEKTSENIQHKLEGLKQKNPDGRSVLIVDDSLYVHYYLATYFTDLGYKIAGFEFNGQKGIEAYNELKPDIMTLDNNMPELNGKDAAKLIYRDNPDAQIIFITALGDSRLLQEEVKELEQYTFNILSKPIKKEDLKDILKKLN